MKPHPDSTIIFNKIKKDSGLNDESLNLIGMSVSKIDTAYRQCISKGMSRKVAMRTIYALWQKADPDVKATPPTSKELTLMGFYHTPQNTWMHNVYPIEISDEYVMQSSFKDIENMVLTKQNASVSPSEDKETK